MILERRTKKAGVDGWWKHDPEKNVFLRSLDAHGIHGGRQIEAYNDEFHRTMAIGREVIMGHGILFKGFVPDSEENWDYKYHVEEWYVSYEEAE